MMDLRQFAIEAYQDRVQKEADSKAKRLQDKTEQEANLLLEVLTSWFGDDAPLTFSTATEEVMASVLGIENAIFFGAKIRPIEVSINDKKRQRVSSLAHLGELLQEPETLSNSEPPKDPEERFGEIRIEEANELHAAGRTFNVLSASNSIEDWNILVIEYTDLWRREQNELTDDELPF